MSPDNFPLGNRLLILGTMLVFIIGALASVIAVWKAVSRTDVERQSFQAGSQTLNIEIYRFSLIPALIASISMLVMLVATLVWGWLVFSSLPQVFFGDFGFLLTSTQAWFYGILALMALCCLAAFLGLARSRSALKPA